MDRLNSKWLNSPGLRYAGSPALRLWRKEGLLVEEEILSPSLWRGQREGRQAQRYQGESSTLFKCLLQKATCQNFAFWSIWMVLLFFCAGCSSDTQTAVIHVNMISDRRSVKISGLDNTIIQEISRDSSGKGWLALIPVYRMPADTDLKNYQPIQSGTYHVKDNAVIFVPDTPFTAHQKYFVRYYKFDAGTRVTDFVTGRNRPGSLHYSDLEFK